MRIYQSSFKPNQGGGHATENNFAKLYFYATSDFLFISIQIKHTEKVTKLKYNKQLCIYSHHIL